MELTPQQLKAYDSSDPSKPIYVAIRGRIYNVTSDKSFYGLTEKEISVLTDWEKKFQAKYPVVGTVSNN
ncbi:hypothetical protein C2S52_017144 [Perilla frutescens var. hirtella]|nr:hypothetical protein C2S52_017144 [Perilla frutescens var. hirtella]